MAGASSWRRRPRWPCPRRLAQPAGRLYGAITLRQLRRQFGRRLPGLRIGDAPKLAHRGVQLSFPQGHTAYRADLMRHLVPELARWKINALYLYLESYFDFPSLPHTAGPGAMTPQQARDLDELCRAYGIALIPQLNVMAHSGELLSLQKYAHLAAARRPLPAFGQLHDMFLGVVRTDWYGDRDREHEWAEGPARSGWAS